MNKTHSQVTPSSKRFEVKNYISINAQGNYYPYHSHGFVENVGSGTSAKMFLMPIIKFDLKNIKYINSSGLETYSSNNDIKAISFPITADLNYPNESQKAAIGASLKSGTTLHAYYSPIVKNNFGGPVINPLAGIYSAQIIAQANKYEENIKKQNEYIDTYNKHTPELISLLEFEVIMKVGSDIVYNNRFDGSYISLGNSLDDIEIESPSTYTKNRIASGNFSMIVKYKFRDSKNSYINAHLNAKLIIDQFLSEAQQSVVKKKSSGWSLLGFGSRRKSIKSKFDQQVNQQYSAERISNTTIEMFDADDNMIQIFENTFFPTLTKQKVIENHLKSAEKAKASGNTELEKYHLDYVKSLQENNPDLEVNIGAAVAALAKKDYVGFIANGVRWGDYKANENSSFRRVLNSSEMSSEQANWSQTKTISVQHSVTQKVANSEKVQLKAYMGLVDGIPYQGNLLINNGFSNQWNNIKGIVLGPITQGGSLHQNNVTPGTLLLSIGSYQVDGVQTLSNALSKYDPNENVNIVVLEQVAPNVFRRKNMSIKLGAFPKVN
jgi:hypothetical protein